MLYESERLELVETSETPKIWVKPARNRPTFTESQPSSDSAIYGVSTIKALISNLYERPVLQVSLQQLSDHETLVLFASFDHHTHTCVIILINQSHTIVSMLITFSHLTFSSLCSSSHTFIIMLIITQCRQYAHHHTLSSLCLSSHSMLIDCCWCDVIGCNCTTGGCASATGQYRDTCGCYTRGERCGVNCKSCGPSCTIRAKRAREVITSHLIFVCLLMLLSSHFRLPTHASLMIH